MQTYKAFIKIALKNSPAAMLYFAIFLVICIISSSQGSDNEKQMYQDKAINFTVLNRDNSELGNAIKDYLSEKNTFVELEDNDEALRVSLYYREIYYALIIPEGFEEAIKNGEDMSLMNYKVADSAMAYYMDMNVESYIQTLKSYIAAGYDVKEAASKTSETLLDSVNVNLTSDTKSDDVEGNPFIEPSNDKPNHYYFFQYMPYVFLALLITAIGPVIITFGQKDVKMRINVSAQSFVSNGIQMVCGVITYGVAVLLLFNVVAFIMYGSAMTMAETLAYLFLTVCFLLVSLGVTFFGGVLFSKTSAMGAFGNVVSLGFSFLGGIFVPLELFGEGMINIARFTPTYWYIQSNNDIIGIEKLSDINLGQFATHCGVQILFAAAFFCVGLAVMRYKRETK